MTLVRVTQEPGVVRDVDDTELATLHAYGVLHSFEREDREDFPIAKGIKPAHTWKPADKKADIVTAPAATTDTKPGE